MRLSKDELNLKVVVRRVATGVAPYGWELHSGDVITPIQVSRTRFRSMEAAFKAGQAGLAEHVAARQSTRRNRPLPRAMANSQRPLFRPSSASAPDDEQSDVMDDNVLDDEDLADLDP
jgi:hypothetical protein